MAHVTAYRASKVPVMLSRKRTWSGQGRNTQHFDLVVNARAHRLLDVAIVAWPVVSVVTNIDTFRHMLMRRPEAWADKDEFVVTYLHAGAHLDMPPGDFPPWPRNDALFTQAGAFRTNPEFNLHLLLSNEVRQELSVWLDMQLEQGAIES